MFTASLANPHEQDYSSRTMVFDKVITSYGGGYDSSTGVFTAPKDGDYYFYWQVTVHGGNFCDTFLKRNGDTVIKVVVDDRGSSDWTAGSNMAFLSLSKGDKVWVYSTTCDYLANDSTLSGWRVSSL